MGDDRTPQEDALAKFEAALKGMREQRFEQAPEHVKELGKIIRQSVERGSLASFRRFLREHGYEVKRADMEAFRDYLIINRVDLKDLEPEARKRLRRLTLETESDENMTADYRRAKGRGWTPRCRDCRFFVRAPNDGSPNGEKSCVEMGTKGIDQACYGFTLPPN